MAVIPVSAFDPRIVSTNLNTGSYTNSISLPGNTTKTLVCEVSQDHPVFFPDYAINVTEVTTVDGAEVETKSTALDLKTTTVLTSLFNAGGGGISEYPPLAPGADPSAFLLNIRSQETAMAQIGAPADNARTYLNLAQSLIVQDFHNPTNAASKKLILTITPIPDGTMTVTASNAVWGINYQLESAPVLSSGSPSAFVPEGPWQNGAGMDYPTTYTVSNNLVPSRFFRVKAAPIPAQ